MWADYIGDGVATLPPPLNLIPSPKTIVRWVFKLTNKCFGVPQRLPCCVKVSILSMLVNFYIPYLLPCQWIPFFAPTYLLTLRSESVPVTSTPKCGTETRDFTIRGRDASEDVASQMNLRSFGLFRDYSNSRTLSKVGEPSRS